MIIKKKPTIYLVFAGNKNIAGKKIVILFYYEKKKKS